MSSVLNKFKQAAKETKVKEQEVTVTDEFSSIASQLMDISALDATTVLELLHVVRGKINVEPANATLFVRTLQQLATLEPKTFKYVPLSERELFNNDKALKNHVSVGCNPVADLTSESWGARQYRGEWGSTIPAGEMAKLLHTRDKNVDTKFLKTLESISGMEQFMDVLPTLPDLALNQVFAECTTFAKNAVTATRHHSTALYSYRGQDIFAGLKGTYAGSSPLVAGANLTPVADASAADYVFSNKFDGTDKCIADMPYTTYAIWAQTAASVPNVYLHPNEFNRVLVTNVPIRLKPLDDEWKEIIATMIKCQAYAAVYMSIKMDVAFYIGLMALLEELYGYFDYVGKITIKTITYDYPRTVKRKAGNTPSPAPDVDMKSASIRTRDEFESQ